mgnify:CR=1 FL=1
MRVLTNLYNVFKDSEIELLKSNKNLLQNEIESVFNSNLKLGLFQFSHFDAKDLMVQRRVFEGFHFALNNLESNDATHLV